MSVGGILWACRKVGQEGCKWDRSGVFGKGPINAGQAAGKVSVVKRYLVQSMGKILYYDKIVTVSNIWDTGIRQV